MANSPSRHHLTQKMKSADNLFRITTKNTEARYSYQYCVSLMTTSTSTRTVLTLITVRVLVQYSYCTDPYGTVLVHHHQRQRWAYSTSTRTVPKSNLRYYYCLFRYRYACFGLLVFLPRSSGRASRINPCKDYAACFTRGLHDEAARPGNRSRPTNADGKLTACCRRFRDELKDRVGPTVGPFSQRDSRHIFMPDKYSPEMISAFVPEAGGRVASQASAVGRCSSCRITRNAVVMSADGRQRLHISKGSRRRRAPRNAVAKNNMEPAKSHMECQPEYALCQSMPFVQYTCPACPSKQSCSS